MKAEALIDRPGFELMKQNDIVTRQYFQYPRWLDEDARYAGIGLEAKIIYMYLFNRFNLSKHNGWMNDNGEVFVIYTRKELAERLNVGEKRVTSAMNVLKEYDLIWERRCGRGFANQIYLSKVDVPLSDAIKSKGGPFDPLPSDALTEKQPEPTEPIQADNPVQSRPAEMTGLNLCRETPSAPHNAFVSTPNNDIPVSASLETQNQPFKNRRNYGFKPAESAVQDPSNPPPSYIDFDLKEKDFNKSEVTKSSQSKSVNIPVRAGANKGGFDIDGQTDIGQSHEQKLNDLYEQADIYDFEDDDASVMRDAIERLYFSESIRIGNAVYPNERIRSKLHRLDCFIVQDTLNRLNRNAEKIKNTGAYVTVVLFNTIMESGSDLIVDPYLNFLRSKDRNGAAAGGDGGP